MNQPLLTTSEIIYPDSDGLPMSDNTKQFRWIVVIKENLEQLFKNDPRVFIGGDLLWYPVEGDNRTRIGPDVMVALGRSKGDRGSYKQWEENNIAPQVVFEILSPGNTLKEMAKKQKFYETYGVQEYYVYDPDKNDLMGWLRQGDKLEVIEEIDDWRSPLLGINFRLSDDELEIYYPNGERFLTYVELGNLLQETRNQLQETLNQLQETETKADRLAAKLRELGIDPENL